MHINYSRCCFLLIFSLLISLPLIPQSVVAQVTNAQQNKMDDFIRDVKFNDVKSVKKALESGMSPNTSDKFGNTVLSISIVEKSTDSAKLLINSPSIDLERPNLAGETPLMMAAFHGSLELVKHLINQRSVEVNHPGWSALHYASTNGHFAIAEFLLDKGAYVDPESPNGTTALMMAARGGHITIVRLLLDRGADLSIHNKLNLTAIDFAEDNNQAEIGKGLRSRWLKLYNKPYPPKR